MNSQPFIENNFDLAADAIETLRPLKIALCSAYHTASDFGLNVISGIPSEMILIKENTSKYNEEDPTEIQSH